MGDLKYPGQLVIQDVLTLHGRQLRHADLIVASPPCQEPSYRAMPWSKAKMLNEAEPPVKFIALFDACFRIQREASEAAGRYIPLIVENVCGAQRWVGRAKWHYGSYYLWGDVLALMPWAKELKGFGGTWFGIQNNGAMYDQRVVNPCRGHGLKCGDKNSFRANGTSSPHFTDPAEPGVKQHGSGKIWFDTGIAQLPSMSARRKAASALIAKIPYPLALHIARCFKPWSPAHDECLRRQPMKPHQVANEEAKCQK